LLLLFWCGILFFYGLTTGELWRTESLRAILGAEFLRSGNWIVPTLYGQPLLTKPPGMYAAIALTSWPFGGVSEWTARLPSALAATSIVFLFYWYFSRQFGRLAGLVAGLILPTSVMWLDKAPSAEIDMLQLAWVAAAILFFLRALEDEESTTQPRASFRWWLAALLCVAGGLLTKWTAPAFFYLTVFPLLAWRGRLWLLFSWRHLVSAAIGASLCFAWAGLAIAQVGWNEFVTTVHREASQHLFVGDHAETIQQMPASHHVHLGYWRETLTHPFKVLGVTLPWSAFALLTLRPSFRRQLDVRGRRLWQAMHCWTWPNLLFWSLMPQHSLRHSFPLVPGIMGLAALVWIGWLKDWRGGGVSPPRKTITQGAHAPRSPAYLATMLVLWLVMKITFVHAVMADRDANRQPRARGEQLAALVPVDQVLYLCRVKDEGIMFYYARPVRRLAAVADFFSISELSFCILEELEWQQWPPSRPAEVLLRLQDEQGAPIVLIKAGNSEASR